MVPGSWSLDQDGAIGLSSGTSKRPPRTSRTSALVLPPYTPRWPLTAGPTRRQGQPLCTGSDGAGWVYLLFADAGFSVPEVKSCC